jgi:hypothetical protein
MAWYWALLLVFSVFFIAAYLCSRVLDYLFERWFLSDGYPPSTFNSSYNHPGFCTTPYPEEHILDGIYEKDLHEDLTK